MQRELIPVAVEAVRQATARGHELGPWRNVRKSLWNKRASCRLCGAKVVVLYGRGGQTLAGPALECACVPREVTP